MNTAELVQEQRGLLREIEEITRVVEPLLARRERLSRRASAIAELMRPLDPEPAQLVQGLWMEATEPGTWADARRRVAYYVASDDGQLKPLAADRPRVYGGGPEDDTGDASVSNVMVEILAAANRPLHKSEILARSAVHPLGPVNASTMTTRLSRDRDIFEFVKNRPGYWALRAWPLDLKRANAVMPEGKAYALALTHLERDRRRVIHNQDQMALAERRLAENRIAAAGQPTQELAAAAEHLEQRLLQLGGAVRRSEAHIRSTWEAAVAAREALGDEARHYPPVPPIDPKPDREPSPGPSTDPLPLFSEDEGPRADEEGVDG